MYFRVCICRERVPYYSTSSSKYNIRVPLLVSHKLCRTHTGAHVRRSRTTRNHQPTMSMVHRLKTHPLVSTCAKLNKTASVCKKFKIHNFQNKNVRAILVSGSVVGSTLQFFGGCWMVVGSGLVVGLLFPVFLHNIPPVFLISVFFSFWYFMFFFLFFHKHFAKTLTMAGDLARSACLPEEMENNLYLDSYSYLYLFEIYIRNKTMSVQLAVA